ncbi:hypothetical protein F2P81_007807 [Scophthalmus maximus]|uniref:Uncharacterized protein n=1 Tax=Scophthalmus maximus TaxID=52904 RepID=A0A6A4TBI5_SCOMX|nr:hypothetical protein F2P81_007807 [Scophthalmus maximus]
MKRQEEKKKKKKKSQLAARCSAPDSGAQNVHVDIRSIKKKKLRKPVSDFKWRKDVRAATERGYCVTPLRYINKDHVTPQRDSPLDDGTAFRPVVKHKDAEFHNRSPATKTDGVF